MNKEIIGKIFPEKLKLIEEGRCPECGVRREDINFRDALSEKEFEISGLCQRCQDSVFGSKIKEE